jgi:exodeoxyribonuclease-5
MLLSHEQIRCKDAVGKWLAPIAAGKHPVKPTFYVAGPAGSGKSTIIQDVLSGFDLNIHYAAFTAKAALVMRSKGCVGATTIHREIYAPKGQGASRDEVRKLEQELAATTDESRAREIRALIKAAGQPVFGVNPGAPLSEADLLVIDECSMVDRKLGEDVMSFGKPVLVIGDVNQLPPLFGQGYFTSDTPDFELTEIHRQAKESPVLYLADKARRGEKIYPGEYGTSKVVTKFEPADCLSADQMIVGRNETRRQKNQLYRQHKGFEGDFPLPGEKLVCLRNNHKLGILNGSQWVCDAVKVREHSLKLAVHGLDDDVSVEVSAHKDYFLGKEPEGWLALEHESFDYGYVMTCHKSQGSQWSHVCIIDQSSQFAPNASKWLYTALTRAADRVTLRV